MSDINHTETKLDLVNLNLREIQEGSFINICGPRKTGKSTLIRDIIQANDWEAITTAFIKGYSLSPFRNKNLQESRVITEITEDKIEELCTDTNHRVVVLDCALVNQSKNLANGLIERLVASPKLTLIMSTQFPSYIQLNLRQKIDYFFVFKDTIVSNKRRIYRNYFDDLLSFESFTEIFEPATSDHGTLVIGKDNKIYTYRAKQYSDIEPEQVYGITSYCSVM